MVGGKTVGLACNTPHMAGVPGPFGGSANRAAEFDSYDAFVPAHLPEAGTFLQGGDVLTGRDHAAFHRLTRALFEERGVYDVTFGYNLARLNLDSRHPDAGYRYALETTVADHLVEVDGQVVRAEFTPTTPFCPQSDTLATGSFRAWNGTADRHEFDLVRVRVDDSHHRHEAINRSLERLERQFLESGVVARGDTGAATGDDPDPHGGDVPF